MEVPSLCLVACALLAFSCSAHGLSSVGGAVASEGGVEREETGTTQAPTTTPAVTLSCSPDHVFNGTDCVCRAGRTGSSCRFFEDYFPADFRRSVQVNTNLNVTYENFMNDTSSPEYKEFVQGVIDMMMFDYSGGFGKVPNLIGVTVTHVGKGPPLPDSTAVVKHAKEVIEPRDGSFAVSVTYRVHLRLPNNESADTVYQANLDEIEKTNEALHICPGCYFIDQPECTQVEVILSDVCDPDYESNLGSGAPYECVTECNSDHSKHESCHSGGVCTFHRDVRRTCTCPNIDTILYLSSNCEYPIHRVGLIVGLSLTFFLILVAIAYLAFRVVNSKHNRSKKQSVKEKLMNQWTSEDITRPNSAVYSIGGFGRQTASPYQTARPFSANTSPLAQTGSPSPDGSQSASANKPLTQPMRINRPEIRGSLDA